MTIQKLKSIVLRHRFGLLLSFALLLTGCHKENEEEVEPQKINIEIILAYPVNGLGDRSYCDLLNLVTSTLSQLVSSMVSDVNFSYHMICPAGIEEVKDKLKDWDEAPALASNSYKLLVLVDETYEDLMTDLNKWREDSHRDVMVLNRHNEKDTRVYYRDIPLYAPAWESGYMAKVDGDKPALLLANNVSSVMIDARHGWLDGYAAAGGNPDEVPVVDNVGYEEKRASIVSDSLFQAGYDNVVCVIGGGQTGALRSLVFHRSLYGDIYNDKYLTLCENDYGATYASYVRYNIFKNSYLVTFGFLGEWIGWRRGSKATPPERVVVYDMMQKCYTQYVMGLIFSSSFYAVDQLCDADIREMAADAEKKYYKR